MRGKKSISTNGMTASNFQGKRPSNSAAPPQIQGLRPLDMAVLAVQIARNRTNR